jgi:hypothetical protein
MIQLFLPGSFVFTDVWMRTTSGFFSDSLLFAGVEDSSSVSCYLVLSDVEDASGSNGMCRRWRFSGFLTLASTVYHVVGRQALIVALRGLCLGLRSVEISTPAAI